MHNPYEIPEEPYYMMDELIEAFKSKSLVVCHMHRQSWGLGHYTETVTNLNTIALIRKMVECGGAGLLSKSSMACFSVEDVIFGIPTAYGWTPEDFE